MVVCCNNEEATNNTVKKLPDPCSSSEDINHVTAPQHARAELVFWPPTRPQHPSQRRQQPKQKQKKQTTTVTAEGVGTRESRDADNENETSCEGSLKDMIIVYENNPLKDDLVTSDVLLPPQIMRRKNPGYNPNKNDEIMMMKSKLLHYYPPAAGQDDAPLVGAIADPNDLQKFIMNIYAPYCKLEIPKIVKASSTDNQSLSTKGKYDPPSYRKLYLSELRDPEHNNGEPSLYMLHQIVAYEFWLQIQQQQRKLHQGAQLQNLNDQQSSSSTISSRTRHNNIQRLPHFRLRYQDDQGDWMDLAYDRDLMEALRNPPSGGLKIRIIHELDGRHNRSRHRSSRNGGGGRSFSSDDKDHHRQKSSRKSDDGRDHKKDKLKPQQQQQEQHRKRNQIQQNQRSRSNGYERKCIAVNAPIAVTAAPIPVTSSMGVPIQQHHINETRHVAKKADPVIESPKFFQQQPFKPQDPPDVRHKRQQQSFIQSPPKPKQDPMQESYGTHVLPKNSILDDTTISNPTIRSREEKMDAPMTRKSIIEQDAPMNRTSTVDAPPSPLSPSRQTQQPQKINSPPVNSGIAPTAGGRRPITTTVRLGDKTTTQVQLASTPKSYSRSASVPVVQGLPVAAADVQVQANAAVRSRRLNMNTTEGLSAPVAGRDQPPHRQYRGETTGKAIIEFCLHRRPNAVVRFDLDFLLDKNDKPSYWRLMEAAAQAFHISDIDHLTLFHIIPPSPSNTSGGMQLISSDLDVLTLLATSPNVARVRRGMDGGDQSNVAHIIKAIDSTVLIAKQDGSHLEVPFGSFMDPDGHYSFTKLVDCARMVINPFQPIKALAYLSPRSTGSNRQKISIHNDASMRSAFENHNPTTRHIILHPIFQANPLKVPGPDATFLLGGSALARDPPRVRLCTSDSVVGWDLTTLVAGRYRISIVYYRGTPSGSVSISAGLLREYPPLSATGKKAADQYRILLSPSALFYLSTTGTDPYDCRHFGRAVLGEYELFGEENLNEHFVVVAEARGNGRPLMSIQTLEFEYLGV